MSFFGTSWDDPKTAAIMGLAGGLLQGNAGAGLQQGLLGYQRQAQINNQTARQNKMDAREDEQYLRQQKLEAEHEAIRTRLREQFAKMDPRFAGMNGPTPAAATAMWQVDPEQMVAYELAQADPIKYGSAFASSLKPKAADMKVVGDTLLSISPQGVKEVWKKPEQIDPNKPFMVQNGQVVPNPAFQQFELEKAARGRPAVTVNNRVENKASESVAGQVGPILEKSLTAAEGALRVGDAAQRVVSALDSGQVITGPGANARVKVAQLGQMLGVGGANDQEILLNTRRVIRGLSEMTLQGRKEMSGQGAITDRESALAEKATSGDISDLTPAEIRELANASLRASQYQMQKHKSRVQSAGSLPGMQNVVPFFDVPEMPQAPAPSAVPTMRWNPQTRKLEPVGGR